MAHGESAAKLLDHMPEKGAEAVDVRGKKGRLSTHTEGGTHMIVWELRDGPAVKVFISPDYAKEIDGVAELKKIAEGIRETK